MKGKGFLPRGSIFILLSSVFCVGMCTFVLHAKEKETQRRYEGVLRDVERQRQKLQRRKEDSVATQSRPGASGGAATV
ncbi:conserved hypothetical protein [Neospora caninum Liverpool]|uniref:Transmembrane protein n=1 Tax=Neospora caninum (strain Liverpool) TaxID=572307 RepID=F0V747_NEOCL|nr:conserved hypothetical protein [Neospora caninum Liverpool]CBZ49538.1 conserved hypothetical protein [Neospora caninum Liverpool]CEL64117.1 TPA: hypothetical protein BN1204_000360 [Neospora caninum Liverpool]|eukprot:XP_003879573.1 conserved hypothetical protein [Neospora caninum Liverpool]